VHTLRYNEPRDGDVLRIPIVPDRWLFGRVISTNAHAGAFDDSWSDCVLLYVFRHVSSTGVPPRPLLTVDLLFPPVISSHELWQQRRCELVENRPFEPGEVLAQHCFESMIWTPPRYFDDKGNRLSHRIEPCGMHGVTLLHGLEVAINDAMHG
jgi:hypothetical protein